MQAVRRIKPIMTTFGAPVSADTHPAARATQEQRKYRYEFLHNNRNGIFSNRR